ncbi:MAG TPA: hypothetical protein VF205_00100 [Nitrospiraceae bacterium]
MSATSMFKMGLLSMVAATGLFGASNGFAADAHQRVDVIGTLNERVAQLDSMKARGEWIRVDVIGTIHGKEVKVSEGPAYPYTKPMSR